MIIIRDAKKEEIPFIREQRVRAYEDHVAKIPQGHWQELKKAIQSEADTDPSVDLIVAETNGKLVGSVALFPSKMDAYDGKIDELDYPEIRMLAVAREARGKGAAKSLINECMKRAKAKGYQSIGLHTGEFMHDARMLYENLGFARVPEYDFVPAEDGIKVLAFRLSL
ncbi:GNAT family N-acetyltransferase [Mesobacillus maritimus]|uniref:GNAT family N-acetyltransferase n=1 Tax=Mesobacillus maritimus TaxID=1643336 RepID=UPI00384CAEA4